MDFGARLRELRHKMGWTQAELGNHLGVQNDTISGYESNAKPPSIAKIMAMARGFHVTTDYLLGFENEPIIKRHDLSERQKKLLLEFIREFIYNK